MVLRSKLLASALIIPLILILAGCTGPRYDRGGDDASVEKLPRAVRVSTVIDAEDQDLSVPLSGVVRAEGQVMISFEVSGTIEQVLVDVGDEVEQGQVLAQLDRRIYIAQRDQASGVLSQAEANLAMLLEGSRPQEISAAEAQVIAAESVLAQATVDFERAEKLYDEGAISESAFDQAGTGLTQAEQAVRSANEQLEMVIEGPREGQIDAARAMVQTSRAALSLASTQLDYATLNAPADGTIASRMVEPGQTIAAGMPVIEIANLDLLEVDTQVPEVDLTQIKIGDEVPVHFPALPGVDLTGTITKLAPGADPRTRAFPLTVKLENPPETVLPGMVGMVHLEIEKVTECSVIPARSVIDSHVFIIEDGIAWRREIEIREHHGSRIYLKGLVPGEIVVINGQHFLEDGEEVVIVDALGIDERTRLDADG